MWFRNERSMMAREATDILQEVAFKKVFARSHNVTGWELLENLQLPSFWLPLYNQVGNQSHRSLFRVYGLWSSAQPRDCEKVSLC
jgi:hypothetical protein